MKLLHAFTGLLLIAAPIASFAQSTVPGDPFNGVSIFSRYRGTPATTRDGGGTIPPRPIPTAPPLFVGTLEEDNRITAVLEIQSPGGTTLLHLKEGDLVPWDQSRVLHISQGTLQLSTNAPMDRVIALGNNLLNQPIVAGTALPANRNPVPALPTRSRRGLPIGVPATR